MPGQPRFSSAVLALFRKTATERTAKFSAPIAESSAQGVRDGLSLERCRL